MSKKLFFVYVMMVIVSCARENKNHYSFEDIAVAIIDDFSKRHPSAYFAMPDTSGNLTILNSSESKYGIFPQFKNNLFSSNYISTLENWSSTFGKTLSYESDSKLIDPYTLSKLLNMNIRLYDLNPMESSFSVLKTGLRGLFVFSSPTLVSYKDYDIISVAFAYNCGHLCYDERAYLLVKFDGKIKVLHSEKMYPHLVR